MTKLLSSYGVPSFVHPVSYVKADNGNKSFVFWSLGLLIGDEKKVNSNLGALANIIICKGQGKTYL